MFEFDRYQGAILGPSSSDSVTTLENKFGKTFSWVIGVFFFFFRKEIWKDVFLSYRGFFFLKKPAKKRNIDQNSMNFTNTFVILTKKVFHIWTKTSNTIQPHPAYYLIFKVKFCSVWFSTSIKKHSTKNWFWLIIYDNVWSKMKFNWSAWKSLPLILFFFFFLTKFFYSFLNYIKGQFWDLPVLILFKKKKKGFDQNKINLGDKTIKVTLAWESILKLLLYN